MALSLAAARAQGIGLGARAAHFEQLLRQSQPLDFIELLTDNHLAPGGPTRWQARALAEQYPVMLHCVGMSLGSVDALDYGYLDRVGALAAETGALWVSDHIAFTRFDGVEYHDLLPLPGTRETLDHLIRRADAVQQRLGRRILLENASRYLSDVPDAMPEVEFLSELCRRSGCGLLLDVNNLYVSQQNLGLDAREVIRKLPVEAIGYVHIAGFEAKGQLLIDTHGAPVAEPVWGLLEELSRRRPDIAVLIERDRNLPPLEALLAEVERARTLGVLCDAS